MPDVVDGLTGVKTGVEVFKKREHGVVKIVSTKHRLGTSSTSNSYLGT